MKLFEVAIVDKGKVDTSNGNIIEKARIVMDPTSVLAKDTQDAVIAIALSKPEYFKDVDRSRLEILVRPFV